MMVVIIHVAHEHGTLLRPLHLHVGLHTPAHNAAACYVYFWDNLEVPVADVVERCAGAVLL